MMFRLVSALTLDFHQFMHGSCQQHMLRENTRGQSTYDWDFSAAPAKRGSRDVDRGQSLNDYVEYGVEAEALG